VFLRFAVYPPCWEPLLTDDIFVEKDVPNMNRWMGMLTFCLLFSKLNRTIFKIGDVTHRLLDHHWVEFECICDDVSIIFPAPCVPAVHAYSSSCHSPPSITPTYKVASDSRMALPWSIETTTSRWSAPALQAFDSWLQPQLSAWRACRTSQFSLFHAYTKPVIGSTYSR
jgi:hypothetical protein